MTDPTLRIEARFSNARLYRAIIECDPRDDASQRRYGPIRSFCQRHHVSYSVVLGYLTLQRNPMGRCRRLDPDTYRYVYVYGPTPTADKLCAELGLAFDYLFSAELYGTKWPKRVVAAVDGSRFLALQGVDRARLALPPAQEDQVAHRELREALAKAFDHLSNRERTVLLARFGLDDGEEKTLDDVARRLGISQERVRQVEASAFRKLRAKRVTRKLLEPFWPAENHAG